MSLEFRKMNVALVSGFRAGGIGFATSDELCHRGYRVYACERNERVGKIAAQKLGSLNPNADIRFLHADVSSQEHVGEVMDRIEEESGHLNCVINNAGHAGTPSEDNLEDLTPEQFQRIIDNNLTTAFMLTQAAVKRFFKPQKFGSFVYLSTNNGSIGGLGQLAYGTAKQALIAMMRVLVGEHEGQNIRFNTVSPGIIETDSENWKIRRAKDPEWVGFEAAMNAMHRIGKPEDVANVVAFLVSDEATFINGVNIPVDGGLRASGPLVPGVHPRNVREEYVDLCRKLAVQEKKGAA